MAPLPTRLVRFIDKLENVAILAAGLCLLVMMFVVTLDVAMRYGFNAPLGWVYDLVGKYLIVAAFFLAVSETLRRGGHVAVDLFRNMMKPRVRRAVDILGYAATAPILLVIVVTGIETVKRAYVRDEVITGVVAWPTWPYYIFVPIGIGLLLLRVILHIVDLVLGGEGYVPSVSGDHTEPEGPASVDSSGDGV